MTMPDGAIYPVNAFVQNSGVLVGATYNAPSEHMFPLEHWFDLFQASLLRPGVVEDRRLSQQTHFAGSREMWITIRLTDGNHLYTFLNWLQDGGTGAACSVRVPLFDGTFQTINARLRIPALDEDYSVLIRDKLENLVLIFTRIGVWIGDTKPIEQRPVITGGDVVTVALNEPYTMPVIAATSPQSRPVTLTIRNPVVVDGVPTAGVIPTAGTALDTSVDTTYRFYIFAWDDAGYQNQDVLTVIVGSGG